MAEFQYTGVDKGGKTIRGKVEAAAPGDVRVILRQMGIRPKAIVAAGSGDIDLANLIKGSGHVPIEILVAFVRQLQVLVSSGIPLVQALEVLSEQSVDRNLKGIVENVRDSVAGGKFFWESLNKYPKTFPKLMIALIRAGESSGSLDQMLRRVTRYLEDNDRLRKMLKSAMMYPIIVVSIGIGVVSALLIFVIPKFEELLKGNNQELPAITQLIIDGSHFMVNNITMLTLGVSAAIYGALKYMKSNEGRAFRDRLFFKMPLFGPIMQKAGVARFARTMQTLLASGVNLIDAIDICRATIDNVVLEEAVANMRTDIEQGKTVGSVVLKMNVFPKMAAQMISIGENTGNLDKMLEKVADFYEAEVEVMIQGMTKLIEPFILVFLGGTVGGLLIAMYLPIFKMAGG